MSSNCGLGTASTDRLIILDLAQWDINYSFPVGKGSLTQHLGAGCSIQIAYAISIKMEFSFQQGAQAAACFP